MKTTMKKGLMLTLLLLLIALQPLVAEGRHPDGRPERRPPMDIEAQCAELITLLELEGTAAEQFAPLFKRYHEEMISLFKQHRPPRPQHPRSGERPARPELTDTEIEQHILGRFAVSRAIVDVREKYYHEFRRFMSPRQIVKLYEIEQFNADRMKREHHKRQIKE